MGRSTHNRNTQNPKPKSDINIKTSDKVLKSLDQQQSQSQPINDIQSLSEHREEIVGEVRIIEHVNKTDDQSSISEILKTINDFAILCQKVSKWYEDNEFVIRNQEAFTNDMLHEFELGSPKDIGRAYKSYLKLRQARQVRRKAKNENRMLAPLLSLINENKSFVKDIVRTRDRCGTIRHEIINASYVYRTTEEME